MHSWRRKSVVLLTSRCASLGDDTSPRGTPFGNEWSGSRDFELRNQYTCFQEAPFRICKLGLTIPTSLVCCEKLGRVVSKCAI